MHKNCQWFPLEAIKEYQKILQMQNILVFVLFSFFNKKYKNIFYNRKEKTTTPTKRINISSPPQRFSTFSSNKSTISTKQ